MRRRRKSGGSFSEGRGLAWMFLIEMKVEDGGNESGESEGEGMV